MLGGLIGAAGSFLAGTLAYGLCRGLGQPAALRLARERAAATGRAGDPSSGLDGRGDCPCSPKAPSHQLAPMVDLAPKGGVGIRTIGDFILSHGGVLMLPGYNITPISQILPQFNPPTVPAIFILKKTFKNKRK